MPLLSGKLLVKCPKTGNEVNVRVTCMECSHYRHTSWEGLHPLIACTYESQVNNIPETQTSKSLNGLKKW